MQSRGFQPGVELRHGKGGVLLVAQTVVGLNVPPHVTHVVLDPVQKNWFHGQFKQTKIEQTLHVEKVVLFV